MSVHDEWLANGGEKLRYNYDLNEDSIVFDLGAYVGDFSKRIYNKFHCEVHAFEPIDKFYQKCKYRFDGISKVHSYCFGLGPKDENIEFASLDDETTSFSENITGCENITGIIKSFDQYTKLNNITHIDLMKINIEGGEYDLLNYLMITGIIKIIGDIQIQFHNFDYIHNAEQKRNNTIEQLRLTHYPTYAEPYIGENWRLK